jgi:hypothetical protein
VTTLLSGFARNYGLFPSIIMALTVTA